LFTTPDDQNQYRLTLPKKLSQSTKPSKVKESIADFTILAELYGELDIIISKLDLSYEGIRCYAGSVIRSWMFQLQRREANAGLNLVFQGCQQSPVVPLCGRTHCNLLVCILG
jgi:hypothetical protein